MKTANKFSYVAVPMLLVATIAFATLSIANIHHASSQQVVASEGGPILLCRPGTNCDPNTNLRTLVDPTVDAIRPVA